jgi:hypothetical protein
MDTSSTETTTVAPPPLMAEPSVFLPRGRIGVCSMFFRWLISAVVIGALGILLRGNPESSQDVIYACIGYPIYAFMLINGIKRAHDMGYSAWGVILLGLLPFLFPLPGDKESNKYGSVPKRWL